MNRWIGENPDKVVPAGVDDKTRSDRFCVVFTGKVTGGHIRPECLAGAVVNKIKALVRVRSVYSDPVRADAAAKDAWCDHGHFRAIRQEDHQIGQNGAFVVDLVR